MDKQEYARRVEKLQQIIDQRNILVSTLSLSFEVLKGAMDIAIKNLIDFETKANVLESIEEEENV